MLDIWKKEWYNIHVNNQYNIMLKNIFIDLNNFIHSQILLCKDYAKQSECQEEYESWREEIFILTAYKHYLELDVLGERTTMWRYA